jgi:hypothetical protein
MSTLVATGVKVREKVKGVKANPPRVRVRVVKANPPQVKGREDKPQLEGKVREEVGHLIDIFTAGEAPPTVPATSVDPYSRGRILLPR